MPKKPENEDQAWILAYSVAASLITLGSSIKHGLDWPEDRFAAEVDERAELIADRAVKRMKERKII